MGKFRVKGLAAWAFLAIWLVGFYTVLKTIAGWLP